MSFTTLFKTVASCSTIWHGCPKNVSSKNQCRVVEASAMLLYIIDDFFSNVLWVGFRQNARKRSSDITYLLIQFYKGFTEYIEISAPPFRGFRSFSAKPFLQLPFKNIAVIEVESNLTAFCVMSNWEKLVEGREKFLPSSVFKRALRVKNSLAP